MQTRGDDRSDRVWLDARFRDYAGLCVQHGGLIACRRNSVEDGKERRQAAACPVEGVPNEAGDGHLQGSCGLVQARYLNR